MSRFRECGGDAAHRLGTARKVRDWPALYLRRGGAGRGGPASRLRVGSEPRCPWGGIRERGKRRAPGLMTPIIYALDYKSVTARRKLGNEALPGRSARSLRSNPALYLASRGCGPTQIGTTPRVEFRAILSGVGEGVDLEI